MEYTIKTINELCTKITDGSHFSPEHDENGVYPMYSSKDMLYDGFDDSDVKRISEPVYKKLVKQDCRPLKNDILIIKDGNSYLKRIFKINTDIDAVILSSIAILRPNVKIINPDFFKYLLRSDSIRNAMANYVSGAAIPRIVLKDFKKMKLEFISSMKAQQKIASILSAYDNLIQNYKKQIEALQTAASELYKEWFVRFRFPGYQTAKFENGIPEGWKVVLASELGEFVRGKNITAEEMQEGMIPVISAGIEPSGFHNQSNVKGVSLTISNSGANAGYLQINYSDIWAADCSYCNSAKHIYFYYELLNNMRVVLFNLQKGAAQPHVYAKDINKKKILLPSTELIEIANKKIKLMHEKIYSLQQQITNLTQQRDLLLPRLMSGKLEVE